MNEKLEEAIREAKCIDYDKAAKERFWWLNKTGGSAYDSLTVMDAFAIEALGGLLKTKVCKSDSDVKAICSDAYTVAEAMMNERTKREQMK